MKQLQQVKRLLAKTPSLVEVVDVLGNEPVALFSVPTAIYCFLRSFGEIDGKQVRLFWWRDEFADIVCFFKYDFICSHRMCFDDALSMRSHWAVIRTQ